MSVAKYTTEELHAAFCVLEWMLNNETVYLKEIEENGIQRTRDRIADIAIRINHAFDNDDNNKYYTDAFDLDFIPALLDLIETPFQADGKLINSAVQFALVDSMGDGQS